MTAKPRNHIALGLTLVVFALFPFGLGQELGLFDAVMIAIFGLGSIWNLWLGLRSLKGGQESPPVPGDRGK